MRWQLRWRTSPFQRAASPSLHVIGDSLTLTRSCFDVAGADSIRPGSIRKAETSRKDCLRSIKRLYRPMIKSL